MEELLFQISFDIIKCIQENRFEELEMQGCLKKIIPFWERIIGVFMIFLSIFVGFEMYREHLLYKKGDVSDIIKLLVLLLSIFILGTINYFLHYIEYDEESDYVCYSVLGRKFKFKLSEVTFVGYLPFGIDGTYQINYKRYALTKSFPITCLFSKNKIIELYEAAKRKNPNCATDLIKS